MWCVICVCVCVCVHFKTPHPIGRFTPYKNRLSSLSVWFYHLPFNKWLLQIVFHYLWHYAASTEEMTLAWICDDQKSLDADASLTVAESTRLSSDFHSVSKFIHHVMCAILPAENITPIFTSIIAMDVSITPMPSLLSELFNCIQTTWT